MNSRYTINIPFICQQCGRCCNWGYPPPKNSETTTHPFSHNGDGENRFSKEMVHKLMTSKPCLFLDDKTCKIYPNRPNVCRYYPLDRVERDSKTDKVLCPGRVRFDEVEASITQHHMYVKEAHHEKICNIDTMCPPTDRQWDETVNNYYSSNPDENEIRIFLEINQR